MAKKYKDIPDEYRQLIAKSAVDSGVPEEILAALLAQESDFDPDVVSGKRQSSAGALGIAQFMPATAQEMGIDPLDPNQAIPGAARYLKQMFDMFGRWDLALAGYNAGPGRVQQAGGIPDITETKNYVQNIIKNSEAFKSEFSQEQQDLLKQIAMSPTKLPTPVVQPQNIPAMPQTQVGNIPYMPQAQGGFEGSYQQVGPRVGIKPGESVELIDAMLGRKAPVTQEYGKYNPALEPRMGINWGTDIGAGVGEDIKNPFDVDLEVISAIDGFGKGWVGNFRDNEGYANQIVVRNTETGEIMQLSHLNKGSVDKWKQGDRIKPGEKFAQVGASGNVTGSHIDVEAFDPAGRVKDVGTIQFKKASQAAFTPTESMRQDIKSRPLLAQEVGLGSQFRLPAQEATVAGAMTAPEFKVRQGGLPNLPSQQFMPGLTERMSQLTKPVEESAAKALKPKEANKEQEALKLKQELKTGQPNVPSMLPPKPKPAIQTPGAAASSGGRPGGGPAPVGTVGRPSMGAPSGAKVYTVRRGDTPGQVAQRLGVPVKSVWSGDPRKMPVGIKVRYGGGGLPTMPMYPMMPMGGGGSKMDRWVGHKIPILRHEGYPQKQATAIAYSMGRDKGYGGGGYAGYGGGGYRIPMRIGGGGGLRIPSPGFYRRVM